MRRRPGINISQTPGYWNPPKPEPARVVSTPPAELHTYQCPTCQTVATSTVRMHASELRCNGCQSWMRYLFSDAITTDDQRALAARGLVFNPYLQVSTPDTRPCGWCRKVVSRDSMIDLGAAGRFCCFDCADRGSERHQQTMDRLETLYQEQPWLRPQE